MIGHVRDLDGILVMDGSYGVTYKVDTVHTIDGNLEGLRWRPGHPDIDLLLDARHLVGTLNFIWPPAKES